MINPGLLMILRAFLTIPLLHPLHYKGNMQHAKSSRKLGHARGETSAGPAGLVCRPRVMRGI